MSPYQSFKDLNILGDSKSDIKLEKIVMPSDLTGKKVLDLGCNEGFFCFEAARRGGIVTGIDSYPGFIEAARDKQKSYGLKNIEFLVADWGEFLKNCGEYDLVLWLSGFHYAREGQQALLCYIVDKALTRDGLLILEAGVSEKEPNNFYIEKVARGPSENDNEPYFPNMRTINSYLSRYDYTLMGHSVEQSGDKIPRYVFHITKRRQKNLTIIFGDSNVGKSFLTTRFIRNEFVFRWEDFLIPWLEQNKNEVKEIVSRHDIIGLHLGEIWRELVLSPYLFKKFCDDFSREIELHNIDTVVEGFGVGQMVGRIKERLSEKFKIREVELRI